MHMSPRVRLGGEWTRIPGACRQHAQCKSANPFVPGCEGFGKKLQRQLELGTPQRKGVLFQ